MQLFFDDFTGADNQEIRLRSGWVENGNTAQRAYFKIASNAMLAQGGGSRGYFVGYNTLSADHWVKTNISNVATAHTVICRATPVPSWASGLAVKDYAYASVGAGGTFISVGSYTNAVIGTLYVINSSNSPGQFPIVDGDSIELRIDVAGRLRVYKNASGGAGGTELGAALNMDMSGVPAGTHVGFLSDTAGTFDNFAAGDFTVGNSIGITSPSKVVNRAKGSTSKALPVAGTYTGAAPAGVEYRVTSSGTPLPGLDWQALSGQTVGGGTWSGTTGAILQGGPYVVDVRKSDDTGITGSSSTFYVGVVVALYGQSNSTRQQSATPTVAITPASNCFTRIAGAFTQPNVAAMQLPNRLSSLLGGIPVALLCEGLGGTAIAGLTVGQAPWTALEAAITAAGGDIEAMYYVQGESDAGGNMTTYKTALDTMYARLKTITGRAASELRWLECQSGTNNAATMPDAVQDPIWSALRTAQAEWVAATPGAYLAATTTDLAKFDDLHYTNDAYVILGNRVAQSYAKVLGAVVNDGKGPIIGSCSVADSVVTVRIALNGATSLTKASGASATCWQVSTDDFATTLTINDVQISGSNVVITLSAAPVGTVKVRHLYYADPDLSNVIKGTGYSFGDIALSQALSNISNAAIYVGSTPVKVMRGSNPLKFYYGSTLISG